MYLQAPSFLTALNATTIQQENAQAPAFSWASIPGPGTSPVPTTPIAPSRIIANNIDITERFDMSTGDFPPGQWLGYGLDLTAIAPLDILSVASNAKAASQIINVHTNSTKQEFYGITWQVPDNVNVNSHVNKLTDNTFVYHTGDDAAYALTASAHMNAQYTAVETGMKITGDAALKASIKASFSNDYQYLFFSHYAESLQVKFGGWQSTINERALRGWVDRVGRWDPTNKDTVEDYRSVFETIGTHIITGATFGARLQLMSQASNSNQTVNAKFKEDVNAEFNGIFAGGKADTHIKAEGQWDKYMGTSVATLTCQGGDPILSSAIQANPRSDTVFEKYAEWVKTDLTNPNLMSFQTTPIWDVMFSSSDKATQTKHRDFEHAYHWLVENPEQHYTLVRLIINSDWAGIAMQTPAAYFIEDPDSRIGLGVRVILMADKVWFPGGLGQQKGKVAEFFILNDGGPVDIALSHGSLGSVEAHFDTGAIYTADEILADNWFNTKVFRNSPVNPVARLSKANPHYRSSSLATA